MRLDVEDINNMSKDARFEYLRQAEKVLIKLKKSSDISSHDVIAPIKIVSEKTISKSKTFVSPEDDTIHVKVVANTANFIDSQMDMIIPGASTKSIKERKGLIPFLHDHLRDLTARIGDVKDIYEAELPLRQLGIDKEGIGTALIFEAEIKQKYNENIFNQYKNGQVNQHSIGLRYIDLSLALNDPTDELHFREWEKFIGQAINPELAFEMGYFWAVKEYKLIENSAVLFGANEITPTLETRSNELETQSQEEAAIEAPRIEPSEKTLDVNQYIKDFKL